MLYCPKNITQGGFDYDTCENIKYKESAEHC
jgi:hypothetical protein